MYDPFIDSFNDEQPLQTPLAPSRTPTPAVAPPPSDAKVDSADVGNAASLFDPLGSITTDSHIDYASKTTEPTRITPTTAYDPSAQPRRMPGMLTISTPTNPPQQTGGHLEDLLGNHNRDDARFNTDAKPRPPRRFSTTPLFQPPPMTHRHTPRPPPSSYSRPVPHLRAPSDEFGAFVSVPFSLDPLFPGQSSTSQISHSAEATNSHGQQPNTTIPVANDFTKAAQQRHAKNAERILGEFARSEAAGGYFLGWLGDAEEKDGGADNAEARAMEEGPPSPPATPIDGPPPSTRVPKQKRAPREAPGESGPNPRRRGDSSSHSRERNDHAPVGSGAGVSSYISPPLPRRLTTLISNAGVATVQVSSPTHHPGSPGESEEEFDDPHGILAMPASTSVSQLSSISPAAAHKLGLSTTLEESSAPLADLARSVTLPSSISSASGRPSRLIPDAYLTHRTPFATVKYVPPSGAPGYSGEEGWDTGGFAADWEGEDGVVDGGDKKKKTEVRKKIPRVMKLIERKPETVGVLTRGLSDVVRSSFHITFLHFNATASNSYSPRLGSFR